jgi:hypothetical protein
MFAIPIFEHEVAHCRGYKHASLMAAAIILLFSTSAEILGVIPQ